MFSKEKKREKEGEKKGEKKKRKREGFLILFFFLLFLRMGFGKEKLWCIQSLLRQNTFINLNSSSL
jgi:hypothetical protein